MDLTTIIGFATFIVTLMLGFLSKKSTFIKNQLIPIQNICIGIIVALIEYAITKDFKTAIALSGVAAGGVYDIFHNLNKMLNKGDE